MSIQSVSLQCASVIALASAAFANSAKAEVSFDLNIGQQRPPVVVQRPAEVGRRWVPESVIRRDEQVLVSPAHMSRREEQVIVEPARRIKREERVLIEPERVEKRPEKIEVRPSRVEKQWIPPVYDEVRVGPIDVKKKVQEGYFREVVVPPVFETVIREVRVPARYDIVFKEIDVPAHYETRIVEVPVPARYETIKRDVIVPGHWEEVVVQPPPVVVPGKRNGFELDLDIGKRHRD